MNTQLMKRFAAGAGALLVALGAATASTGTAHARDTTNKPREKEFQAAAYALDVVEDAVLLNRPLPPHDPALGSSKIRLSVATPGYDPTAWFHDPSAVAVGSVTMRVSATGVAPGALTVWAKAGGHACVPNTASKWRRFVIPNGGTFSFALKDEWYSTGIFLRVSDSRHNYRYESVSVRVGPKDQDEGGRTPAVITWD